MCVAAKYFLIHGVLLVGQTHSQSQTQLSLVLRWRTQTHKPKNLSVPDLWSPHDHAERRRGAQQTRKKLSHIAIQTDQISTHILYTYVAMWHVFYFLNYNSQRQIDLQGDRARRRHEPD